MFDQKKLNFWRLAVIFAGFTGITLLSLWMAPREPKASMMNESMATMAKMHLENVTIYDLTGPSEQGNQTSSSDSTQHHKDESSGTKTMGIVTTLIIFGILPLLICGTIILAIIWIK